MCSGVSELSSGDSASCAGDSGSPAIIPTDWIRDVNGHWGRVYAQIGVLYGGASQCNAGLFPSIFTRLDEPGILQFIQNELNKSGKL